jgi:putative ABC transport system permease protein
MFSLQRTLTFGYLGQHPTRAGLIVVSIALGVAVLVATQALKQSLSRAADEAINPFGDRTDLVVVNAQSGIPRDLTDRLTGAHIPGLGSVRPLVMSRVVFPDLGPDGRSVLLLGINWSNADLAPAGPGHGSSPRENPWGVEVEWRRFQPQDFLELTLWRAPALVSPQLAEDLALFKPRTPPRYEILAASRRYQVEVVGTVRFPKTQGLLAGDFILLDLASASALAYPGRPGVVSVLNLQVEPGANVEQVRRRAQQVVGDAADVRTVQADFQSTREVTAGLELAFDIGGAGALVIGLFLVYNVLSVSVAERRHDIGILRSVGATRGQVARLFLTEAALLGLAGGILGLPLGYGLGRLALGPVLRVFSEILVAMGPAGFGASPRTLLLALAGGVATALLSALVPAHRAAGEQPADAVRRVPVPPQTLHRMLQAGAVVLLWAAGAGAVICRHLLPPRAGVFAGVVCLMVGAILATPLLTAGIGRLLQPVFHLVLGLEGRLGADNLVRSPRRTGLVIAALAATGGLLVQTAGLIRSTEEAIFTWIDRDIAADLFVTCGSPLTQATLVQPLDARLRRTLASLDEVDAVVGVRFHLLDFRDRLVFLLAADTDAFGPSQDRSLARNLGRYPRLRQGGTALVSENFAALYGVRVGDRIQVRGPRGPLELEVLGTILDYTWNRGTILVDRTWYRRVFADPQVDILDVFLKPGADPEEVRRIIRQR